MCTFRPVLPLLLHVFIATYADNFLSLDVNSCFERVSIGKSLNSSDVTKTIYNINLKRCSNECERIVCNAYSYGVNGNGNGTCLLSLDLPKSRPYDDPEYDLFMKILQCRDRTTCFNKLVGGRRLTDKYIRRTLPVESKGDCELHCEYEKEFRCEGFNFRYDVKLDLYSSCQLTSVPSTKLDLSLDFQSDLDYDFFEKNVNASPSCRYLDLGNIYGLGHQWGFKPDLSYLWQELNPSLYQRNDVGYGNDNVYYDGGVLSTTPVAVPEYDGLNLLVRPNTDLYDRLGPTLSPADRLPVSINECFIKVRTGHHLQRENIIKSTNAPSLYGCETFCANEQTFTCNIFSYRYTFTSSMDNCHMGDKMIRQLDVFQDLVQDRDGDVFARNELSQPGCQPSKNWDTDCFERIHTSLTFEVSIIKFSVQTENVHECELICLHVKHFTCRLFSFRRGTPVIEKLSDNCYLTDYPVIEIDPVKHFVRDPDCDIYNRGSYGRGCELDKPSFGWPTVPGQDQTPTVLTTYRPQYDVPFPSLYGSKYGPPQSPPLQFFPTTVPPPESPQYFPVGPSSIPSPSPPPLPVLYPVTPTVFRTSTKSTGTYVPSHPPTTFFQIPGEYTPVSIRPFDRQPDVFPDSFDPYGVRPTQTPTIYGAKKKLCYINFGTTARLSPSAVKKTINVESEYHCKMECNKARENQYFRCSTLSYFGGYCELSDVELRDLKPYQAFNADDRFLLFTWDFDERQCFSSPAAKFPTVSSFPDGLQWTWMRFTVNGQPCRSGSFCSRNTDVGVWSCPVDQGEWDYCCRPDHKCGYSEGISYPWCYVGNSTEQWRPCTDKYYPSGDGSPQTWPVTYIHHTGPPTGSSPTTSYGPPTAPPYGPPAAPPYGPPVPSDGPPLSSFSPPFLTDRGGTNNGTQPVTKHEQSLVDQFLSIFSFSSAVTSPPSNDNRDSKTAVDNANNSNKTVASLTAAAATNHKNNYYRYDADPVPGFRVVDVTNKPRTTIPKLEPTVRPYSYGESRDRFGNTRKPYVYV